MSTVLRTLTSRTGLSRRKAFAAIREGRVAIDGAVCTEPSETYGGGRMSLDGSDVREVTTEHVYLLLNKPPGFVTTVSDEMGRRTVLDLVPPALYKQGLHPVGRLDRDTSGLLLLTTDGDFTHALTHPRYEVEKEYWLRLAEPADERMVSILREGVDVDGALRRPMRLRRLVGAEPFQLSITLREGRNRQVRRMVESADGRVTALRRVREGDLTLEGVPEGAVRRLTAPEVQQVLGKVAPSV